ncbi:MAG: NAD-dependent DNA ligase LigA [Clostridiales bacterium]|jgi:DNA ligase (NAD+)|nr:NAD-dependent DNA ligase LigA [Clostridiales bacterium]
MDTTERMQQILRVLIPAARAYYQENTELMPNREYDALYDELAALERETGIVLPDSPTQYAGYLETSSAASGSGDPETSPTNYAVVSSLVKIRHSTPMLSLDKTKDIGKLAEFLGDKAGILSWKMDGLTVVVKYIDGCLAQAVTRGNGEVGEDVTHNARVFTNLPLVIDHPGELVLRGEAMISFREFDRINEALPPEDKYKNPRNLCSGTVRQLDSSIAASRGVTYHVFGVISSDYDETSKSALLEKISELGFCAVEFETVDQNNIENTVRDFELRVQGNPFATDGLVLAYDDIMYSQSLGATSKFPRDAIALKWADEAVETILTDVIWNTSRTGLVNPVAVFEPVEIESTTVRQASVHNISVFRNLKLGVGDVVSVYKANMIIPQIAENLTRSATIAPPVQCPVCGHPTRVDESREGKVLRCDNPNCPAQILRSLAHFVSRDAMNIEGLSEQTLEKFINAGFIKDFTDIYSLHTRKDDIICIEGFGQKSYERLVSAIERSRSVAPANLLYALGIYRVGLSTAKLLCAHFNDDITRIMAAAPDQMQAIPGIGPEISDSVRDYFDDPVNVALLEKILPLLSMPISSTDNQDTETGNAERRPLEGLVFVITGDLVNYKNRRELQKHIESLGGKVTSSVTSKTNYLINNDRDSASAKNKRAKSLGVHIINDTELTRLYLPE